MANKQFHTYKRVVDSFEAVEAFNGIIAPGRHKGFDTINAVGSGTITIGHTITGIQKVTKVGELTVKQGIVVTSQGQFLHIDGPVNLPYTYPTLADGDIKQDILYAQFNYLAVPTGGVIAFGIQYGTINGGIPVFSRGTIYDKVPLAVIKITRTGSTYTNTIRAITPPDDIKDYGIIKMYDGNVANIPYDHFLCDGTNGTPNLKGKFIVGYDSTDTDYNAIGKTGGQKNMPQHNHGITDPGHAHLITDPGHGHNITDPGHIHGVYVTGASLTPSGSTVVYASSPGWSSTYDVASHTTGISVNSHGTDITINGTTTGISTNNAGSGAISDDNRPPFYTLALIKYLPITLTYS
jgi:hypothetical protein